MEMLRIFSITILFYTFFCAAAQAPDISITGTVTDGRNPVEKAVVTLVSDPRFFDTTDSRGAFSLSNVTGTINRAAVSFKKNSMRLQGSRLHISIPGSGTSGSVMLYTARGNCIQKYPFESRSSQSIIDLPELSTGIYFLTFTSEQTSLVRKLVTTSAKMYLCESNANIVSPTGINQISQTSTGVDQLRITKENFLTKQVEIPSYKTENLSIVFEPESIANATSLHKRYTNFFSIGAAVDGNSYKDNHAAIWKTHFNAMVCENEMKWTALQPSSGNFQFSQANAMVNAARSSGMLVRGHVLCWFDQTLTGFFRVRPKRCF
jgi:hypothetical protein